MVPAVLAIGVFLGLSLPAASSSSTSEASDDNARYKVFHDQWTSLILTSAFTPDPDAVASVCK